MFGRAFEPPPPEFRGSFRMAFFLFVVFFVLFGVGVYHARAHSWYPWECCSTVDCYPVPIATTEFERTPDGWRLKKEGIVIPFDAARVSPDRNFHICRDELGKGKIIIPSGKPPCLWVPESDG